MYLMSNRNESVHRYSTDGVNSIAPRSVKIVVSCGSTLPPAKSDRTVAWRKAENTSWLTKSHWCGPGAFLLSQNGGATEPACAPPACSRSIALGLMIGVR